MERKDDQDDGKSFTTVHLEQRNDGENSQPAPRRDADTAASEGTWFWVLFDYSYFYRPQRSGDRRFPPPRLDCKRFLPAWMWLSLAFLAVYFLLCGIVYMIWPWLFRSYSRSLSPRMVPPAYPLAVRNPYLSGLPGNDVWNVPSSSAQYWNGRPLTWSVIARVDDKAYSLFGVPNRGHHVKPAYVTKAEFTATHTRFWVETPKVPFVLDFFSPVPPQNLTRQSLPFSYLTVIVGEPDTPFPPAIQIYSDIHHTWTTNTEESVHANGPSDYNGAAVLSLSPANNSELSEVNHLAPWASTVHCTRPYGIAISSEIGNLDDMRSRFVSLGAVGGFHNAGTAMGISHSLGHVSDTRNVTFVVGIDRDPAVNYMGQNRSAYWRSECSDMACGCILALNDHEAAYSESTIVDATIGEQATAVGGPGYAEIATLSLRQAFGAIDLTIPTASLSTNDTMAFMKEMGNAGSVNTLDAILPLSPALYAMAPEYLRLLLEPIMRYMSLGRWKHGYPVHDIGPHYPQALGHDDNAAHDMPVEECGDILLLAYMYQKAGKDKQWAYQYSHLFQRYADFLLKHGAAHELQSSSDSAAGPLQNQTNIAIKSAIALNAYGTMFGKANYTTAGKALAANLYDNRLGTDANRTHFTLTEGDDASWVTAYNLYMDILLDLHTFNTSAYAMQSSFYPSVRKTDGVPLDSRVLWAKTDWMMFAAATAMSVGNNEARDMFVNDVRSFVANRKMLVPFSDRFVVEGKDQGMWSGEYRARPVVGGHFALMALGRPGGSLMGGIERERKERRWVEW